MISIKTNELKTRKRVLIDDHEYVVRQMGNIEQLDYVQGISRLQKIAAFEKARKLTDKEEREIESITQRLTEIFVSMFDDGESGAKSRKLIGSLSDVEIKELITQIFASEDNEDGSEA